LAGRHRRAEQQRRQQQSQSGWSGQQI
jgi:hypothetical protein